MKLGVWGSKPHMKTVGLWGRSPPNIKIWIHLSHECITKVMYKIDHNPKTKNRTKIESLINVQNVSIFWPCWYDAWILITRVPHTWSNDIRYMIFERYLHYFRVTFHATFRASFILIKRLQENLPRDNSPAVQFAQKFDFFF